MTRKLSVISQGWIQKIQKEGAAETDDAVLHHAGGTCDQTLGLTPRTFQKYRKKEGGRGPLAPPPPPSLNPPMSLAVESVTQITNWIARR